jgi:glycosyltransferase involved in cell wall biosynthesis
MTAPMRIAFGVPELDRLQRAARGEAADGTDLLQAHVASSLRARGHRLTYIAQRGLGEYVCSEDLARPADARYTWSGSRAFDRAARLAWQVQRRVGVPYLNVFTNWRLYDASLQCLPSQDVVWERAGLYRDGVALACRRLGVRFVLNVEGDEIAELDYQGFPVTGLLRWRAQRIFRRNLKIADSVICVSEPLKKHLVAKWRTDPAKILVMPNGVDVETFRPDREDAPAARASLGEGGPIALFVGSFYSWHDVSTLLHAFRRLLVRHPAARLVLVGDGAVRRDMELLAAELHVEHRVRFTGLMPHAAVPPLVAAADIAVVPYPVLKQEMWLSPLKLFEYMASGKAIVASACGQVLDVIEDGRNGILVPPGDAEAMTAALDRLVDDSELRGRLGRTAREDAVERHSWESYVSRLEQVLYGQPSRECASGWGRQSRTAGRRIAGDCAGTDRAEC